LMARAGHRIGVFGATGSLGGEVLAALDASALRVALLRPMATDASLGADVEFQGEVYPVETDSKGVAGLDAVIACAPMEASLTCVREALRSEVFCIDGSGSLAGSGDIPVYSTWLPRDDAVLAAPVVTSPPGPALAWSAVLAPLHAEARIRSVTGTALEAASVAGRGAIDTLYAESLAIFGQQDAPDPEEVGQPVAFDCLPALGIPEAEDGVTAYERTLASSLQSLLGAEFAVRVTAAHVPAFVGHAASLVIDTETPLDAKQAREILSQSAGVELWGHDDRGPNLRAATGREVALVGRVRSDGTPTGGLQLWLAADLLRLAGHNAVRLLAERFGNA
jgi:aspartate-semialdehyde dehydrogenase